MPPSCSGFTKGLAAAKLTALLAPLGEALTAGTPATPQDKALVSWGLTTGDAWNLQTAYLMADEWSAQAAGRGGPRSCQEGQLEHQLANMIGTI